LHWSLIEFISIDHVRIKVCGVAEKFSNIWANTLAEILNYTSGSLFVGQALSVNLSEIVGNGSNLENFLEKGSHHILRLTHISLIAVGEVVVKGLIKLTVVSNCLHRGNEVWELSVPVKVKGRGAIEDAGKSSLCCLVKAIVSYSVIVLLIHSSAVSLDKASSKCWEKTNLRSPAGDNGTVLSELRNIDISVSLFFYGINSRYLLIIFDCLGGADGDSGKCQKSESGFHFRALL
jgi:hypothetical protein